MLVLYICYWLFMLSINFYINKKVFSPYLLFHFTWMLPPILNLLYKNIFPEYSLNSLMLFYIIFIDFCFFLGELLFWGLYYNKRINKIYNKKINQSMDVLSIHYWKIALDKPVNIISVISLIAFCINMAHAILVIGVTPFTTDLRTWEYAFGWNRLVNYIYFLNMLAAPLMLLKYTFFRRKIWLNIMLIHLATLFFHGIKGTVIFGYLLFVFIYFLNPFTKKRKLKRYFLILFSALIITYLSFCFVTYFRLPLLIRNSMGLADIFYYVNNKIVLYIIPSYANLQLVLFEFPKLGGDFLFNKIFYFITNGMIKFKYTYDIIPLVNEAYTIGTFFRDFAIDFGIGGVAFVFYISFIVNWFRSYFYNRRNIFTLLTMSILLCMVFMSFWFNEFLRPQFFFFILFSWVFHKYIISIVKSKKQFNKTQKTFNNL